MEIKRVYLVTMDGEYEDDFGAEIYLVGIFTEEALAEFARDQAIKDHEGLAKDAFKITSVDLNNPYNVKLFCKGSWETFVDL